MEWSSKRTWKERKVAKNSKKTSLASPDEEPELIFYGNSAGVVGRSKEEVYLIKDQSEMSISGYDKVEMMSTFYGFSTAFLLQRVRCLTSLVGAS